MKIGIVTDIHNNAEALKVILEKIEQEQVEGIICAGDIIGIGPHPEETVTMIRNLDNLLACVRGNHEEFLLEGMPKEFPNEAGMSQGEMLHHEWEHKKLSRESRDFLKNLPYTKRLELEGRTLLVTHYPMDDNHKYAAYIPRPTEEELDVLFGEAKADINIYGHNHLPCTVIGAHVYINSGSLGCPAGDHDIARAGILILDKEVEYKALNLVYDVTKVISDIDRFGYPDKDNIKKYFYGCSSSDSSLGS